MNDGSDRGRERRERKRDRERERERERERGKGELLTSEPGDSDELRDFLINIYTPQIFHLK